MGGETQGEVVWGRTWASWITDLLWNVHEVGVHKAAAETNAASPRAAAETGQYMKVWGRWVGGTATMISSCFESARPTYSVSPQLLKFITPTLPRFRMICVWYGGHTCLRATAQLLLVNTWLRHMILGAGDQCGALRWPWCNWLPLPITVVVIYCDRQLASLTSVMDWETIWSLWWGEMKCYHSPTQIVVNLASLIMCRKEDFDHELGLPYWINRVISTSQRLDPCGSSLLYPLL